MNNHELLTADVKTLSTEDLATALTTLNELRDTVRAKSRLVTAEQASRVATEALDAQVAKLTPEAREALKASL